MRYSNRSDPKKPPGILGGQRLEHRAAIVGKVQVQCLLSAACRNMKKMALLLARKAAALLAKILGPAKFATLFAHHLPQVALHHENVRIRLISS